MNIKRLKSQRQATSEQMSGLVQNKRDGELLNEEERAKFDEFAEQIKEIDLNIKKVEELRSLQESKAVEVQPDNEEFRSFLKGEEVRSQTVGTNSQGGYLAQGSTADRIVEKMKDFGGMMANSQILQTENGSDLLYPTLDDLSNDAVITAETDARRTGPDLVFGNITLKSFTYDSGIIKVSNELIQDSKIDVEGIVINALAQRIQRKLETDFTIGNGTTAPAGVLTQAPEGAETSITASVNVDDVIDLLHSVDEVYAMNGKFMMNSNTLKALRKLKDSDGNYLLTSPIEGAKRLLLGKEIIVDNDMPDIATGAKPILFGDFNQYLVRSVDGLNIFRFNEKYQDTNEVGFKASARFDGTLLQPAAIKHLVVK